MGPDTCEQFATYRHRMTQILPLTAYDTHLPNLIGSSLMIQRASLCYIQGSMLSLYLFILNKSLSANCNISIANALKILLSCTNPYINIGSSDVYTIVTTLLIKRDLSRHKLPLPLCLSIKDKYVIIPDICLEKWVAGKSKHTAIIIAH